MDTTTVPEEEIQPNPVQTENTEGEGADGKRKPARLGAFLARRWSVLLSPAIVFVMYFIQLAVSGVYPFGNDYVVASYDLSAQICPFIEHLFDVLDGKSSLFYSYAIAGGADVFGTFAYFFISPFSFIFLLFGDGNVYNACGVVTAFKLAAIAFSGAWFVKKLFKGIPDYIGTAIGVVYAYCGYTFVASTYINWMDFLVYMPFCAAAFAHFVRSGKFFPFSVAMACCIYTCFSIACFSMLAVFPSLIAYALFCVKKENRNSFIAYLCLSFFVAILLALPLLLSALMAYLRSGRGGGLFDELWYGFATEEGKTVFNVKTYFDRSGEALYRKFSYIFSDSVFVVLTVFYFVRSKLKTPLSRFMLAAGIFTLVPVFVDEATLLMNMGSYMSYALRFGFLNALYFLGGACLAIDGLSYRCGTAFDGTPLEGGVRKRSVAFYVAACLIVAAALSYFVISGAYLNIWDKFVSDSTMLSNAHGFSGMFAHSLGGLQVVAVFFLLVGFVAALGLVMVRKKKIGVRAMSLFLLVAVAVQVLFYNEQLVVGNASTHYNMDHYKRMVAQLNEREEDYFRVKDYDDKLTANVPFTGQANSFSVFSSVIDKDNFEIVRLFGYSGNGRNSMKSAGGGAFGDAFLGYKYFFVSEDRKDSVERLSYVSPVEIKDESGEVVKDEKGKAVTMHSGAFYMFENTIAFPSGYTVQRGDFRFVKENTSANRTENQRALYEFLGGKRQGSSLSSSMIGELSRDLWKRAAKVEVGAGKITAEVTAEEGEYLFLNFVASKGYTATVNGEKTALVDNDLHFLCVPLKEGKNTVEISHSSPYVKYFVVGIAASVVALLTVFFVVKRTKFMQKASDIIAWAGIGLALVVVTFFMIFPAAVCFGKLIASAYTKLRVLF